MRLAAHRPSVPGLCAGSVIGSGYAHLLHRRQRQGRQARRNVPRRAGAPGHERRPRPATAYGRRRPPGRPDRRRRGLLGARGTGALRRARPAGQAGLRRRRALRRSAGDPADVGGEDVRDERAQHVQRARGRDAARRAQGDLRVVGDDVRRLLRPGRAAAALRAGRRGAPDGAGGLLRDVEGRQRGDGTLLPGPHRRRHLRPAHQQRHRAARVRRDVPAVPHGPGAAAAQHLRLHRHPRPRPDGAALPRGRRAGLRGLQRRQRRHVRRRDDRRGARALLRRGGGAAADGAQRDLLLHRQGPRPARLLAAALVARRPDGPARAVKAVVYDDYGRMPYLADVTSPACPEGGVVIAVRATGVCRSDWHAWKGHDPVSLPHTPGHELAGVVAEVGVGVRDWVVGDRVTVPFVCGCGVCSWCLAGEAQVCPDQTQPGFTGPGSFAELVAIHAADTNLVRLPDSVDFVTAASLGCRFATAFRALTTHGRLGPGEWLAVHGCGGVGLSAVMIGAALGARVVAVDVNRAALERASALGAAAVVDAGDGADVAAAIREVTGGGAQVSIDAFGSPDTAV